MKINLYNFELYRFKFGAFFETQCASLYAELLVCTIYKQKWKTI